MNTLNQMYIELVALKLEIYLTKLEKKRMRSKAETAEAGGEAKSVLCYWNGEVVDCVELSQTYDRVERQ